jgi:hypothetical protein
MLSENLSGSTCNLLRKKITHRLKGNDPLYLSS